MKLKAVEALQSGVPTVATRVGAESIPTDVEDLLEVTDDPKEFAEVVALLHGDRARWSASRRRMAAQVAEWSHHPQQSIWPELITSLTADRFGGAGRE